MLLFLFFFSAVPKSHFGHILNYLRAGGVVTLPKDDEEKLELAHEADFYGLEGLAKEIRAPKVRGKIGMTLFPLASTK